VSFVTSKYFARLVVLLLTLATSAYAAPVINVSPTAITSIQQTNVQLAVTGVSPGVEIFIEQFVDANRDGSVDSSDTLVRSFFITDGASSTVNPNIQGDEDGSANGTITTTINYQSLTDLHSAGWYLFQATDADGADDATFTITPYVTPQSVSGTITPQSGSMPGVLVVLLDPVIDVIRASTFADAVGNYQLYAPESGDYFVGAITTHSGYYSDFSEFQAVSLAADTNITGINIVLGAGGNVVSGKIVDENNPANGVNGIQVEFEGEDASGNEVFAVTVTDADGNFSATVPNGDYEGMVYGANPDAGAVHKGFIAYDEGDEFNVSGNVTGIVGEIKPVDRYVSGQVVDSFGIPVPGIIVGAGNWGDADEFEASAVTDENGNYTLGLVPSNNWHIEVSWDEDNEINYLFIGDPVNINTSTDTLTDVNFEVRRATAWIEGVATLNSGDPVDDEWITAELTNWRFNHGADTTETGFYRMPVFAGEWKLTPYPNGCMSAAFVEVGETVTINVNYDGAAQGACNDDVDDLDGDGIPNNNDNCPATSNASQMDVSADDIGDACDTGDFDGDGISDRQETIDGTDPAVFNRGWGTLDPTTYTMTFAGNITIDGISAAVGDEIGVFDPDGIFCGHAVLNTLGSYTDLIVYGDDPTTTGVDEGADAGDLLRFEIWDDSAMQVFDATSTPSTVAWANNGSESVDLDGRVWQIVAISAVDGSIAWLDSVHGTLSPAGYVRIDNHYYYVYESDSYTDGVIYNFAVLLDCNQLTGEPDPGPFDGLPSAWADVSALQGGDLEYFATWQAIPDLQINIPLLEGWNLISIPLNNLWYVGDIPTIETLPSPGTIQLTSIDDLFSSINGQYELIRGFDTNGAETYAQNIPEHLNSLEYVAGGYGYLIKMNQPGTLTLTGQAPSAADSLQLHAGWNLVGHWGGDENEVSYDGSPTYVDEVPINIDLADIHDYIEVVHGLDATGTVVTYDPADAGAATLNTLEAGKGYWIKLTEGATLNFD